MDLWLSGYFLVAGLFLSSSALTPEECQPLVTPLSLADPSMMHGKWNFIGAYSDNEVYTSLLKAIDSSWINVTQSPSSSDMVVVSKDRINGTCWDSTMNMTIEGNTASMSFANLTSDSYLLPSCDGCLLLSANDTSRDLDKILQMLKVDIKVPEENINAHLIYLMARESTLKDSDMERFKQQASCLGFSGEPDFLYDPKNEFCAEGEGVTIKF